MLAVVILFVDKQLRMHPPLRKGDYAFSFKYSNIFRIYNKTYVVFWKNMLERCEEFAALFPQSNRAECVEVYLYDMDTVPSLGESQVFVPLRGGAERMSLQVIGFDPPDIIAPQ